MRRLAFGLLILIGCALSNTAMASGSSPGSCISSRFGGSLICGGQYVLATPGRQPTPPVQHVSVSNDVPVPNAPDAPQSPRTRVAINAAPASPCAQFVPSVLNPALAGGLAILTCQVAPIAPARPVGAPAQAPPSQAVPAIDPGALAVQFWQTIPLPVPHPSIPPNYAVTGMPAYVVTNGTLAPSPYQLLLARMMGPGVCHEHGTTV
jgi:hypothetical protein